jgi:hypothetical protein
MDNIPDKVELGCNRQGIKDAITEFFKPHKMDSQKQYLNCIYHSLKRILRFAVKEKVFDEKYVKFFIKEEEQEIDSCKTFFDDVVSIFMEKNLMPHELENTSIVISNWESFDRLVEMILCRKIAPSCFSHRISEWDMANFINELCLQLTMKLVSSILLDCEVLMKSVTRHFDFEEGKIEVYAIANPIQDSSTSGVNIITLIDTDYDSLEVTSYLESLFQLVFVRILQLEFFTNLEESDLYLGIPFTRDIRKYTEIILKRYGNETYKELSFLFYKNKITFITY